MCRGRTTADYHPQRHRLKIGAFYLRLSLSSSPMELLPDYLTLVLLPRSAAAAGHVYINGSKVPSDSPAFISLHRLLLSPNSDANTNSNSAVFATRDRLRASHGQGLCFEVHLAQHRLLSGAFHREVLHESTENGGWNMDCKCILESNSGQMSNVGLLDVREAEVSAALEGGEVVAKKVVMTGRRRCRRRRGFKMGLDDIPEEREEDADQYECCCCCGEDKDEDGQQSSSESNEEEDDEDDYDYDRHEKDEEIEMEKSGESMRWAVDVGIWMMCVGVGILVSTASVRRLRRRKLIP